MLYAVGIYITPYVNEFSMYEYIFNYIEIIDNSVNIKYMRVYCKKGVKMMKKNTNIIARKIHDTFFLINIKDDYSDEKCRLYEINEIGYFIWNNISDGIRLEEVISLLLEAIVGDVDENQVRYDVKNYVASLVDMGFIEE